MRSPPAAGGSAGSFITSELPRGATTLGRMVTWAGVGSVSMCSAGYFVGLESGVNPEAAASSAIGRTGVLMTVITGRRTRPGQFQRSAALHRALARIRESLGALLPLP